MGVVISFGRTLSWKGKKGIISSEWGDGIKKGIFIYIAFLIDFSLFFDDEEYTLYTVPFWWRGTRWMMRPTFRVPLSIPLFLSHSTSSPSNSVCCEPLFWIIYESLNVILIHFIVTIFLILEMVLIHSHRMWRFLHSPCCSPSIISYWSPPVHSYWLQYVVSLHLFIPGWARSNDMTRWECMEPNEIVGVEHRIIYTQ